MFDWTQPQHLDVVRNTITLDWILANVDQEEAAANEANRQISHPPSSKTDAPHEWQTIVSAGTWRVSRWGELSVLMRYYISEAWPNEEPSMWDSMLQYDGTVQVYREWARAGHVPPPVDIIENIQMAYYTCQGRRRWLVARDLGHETLWGWFSPTARRGEANQGRALWLKPTWGGYWQEEIKHRTEISMLGSVERFVLADFGLANEWAQ